MFTRCEFCHQVVWERTPLCKKCASHLRALQPIAAEALKLALGDVTAEESRLNDWEQA